MMRRNDALRRGPCARRRAVPAGRQLYWCSQRADSVTVFHAVAKTGGPAFTGRYAPVGNQSRIVFIDFAMAR